MWWIWIVLAFVLYRVIEGIRYSMEQRKKLQENFDVINGKKRGNRSLATLRIASYYYQAGDKQKAKSWYREAEEIAREENDIPSAGIARHMLDNWEKYYA